MVPYNLPHHWKCRSRLSMPFILPHRHLALFALTRLAFSFLETATPAGVPIIRVSFLPYTKLQSLSTLTSFKLSCRHLAPHGYYAPFCLHQLQDFFLLFIRTFGIARCHLRLRHLSLFSSLSSRGSYCAPLPFITSGLLPTTYAKLGNGGMSSVDSASLSLSSSSSSCAPPTIEVSFIQSSVTERNMTVAIDSNARPHPPPLFDIVHLCRSHHWGFLSHKAA